MVIAILVNCNSQSVVDSIQNQLLGKWFSKKQHTHIEFSKDKIYKFCMNNEACFTENYQIVLSKDSIFRYHYNNPFRAEDSKYDTTKYLLYLNGGELLQMNYKSGLGINEHIDEFDFFYKQGTNNIQQDTQKMEMVDYLLPTHFTGQIMIAYKGSRTEKIVKEKIIKIPDSGLLEVEKKEDIQNYARQNVRFYYPNGDSVPKIPIKKLDFYKKYSAQELKQSNETEICVIALGYNQANRPDINALFGKEIIGNVEFYVVDTFQNLIKYLEK
jgi:hypothetical protein